MEARTQKRFIIGSVYVLIFALIGYGAYLANWAPSCTDGRQNGQEEGIDCGVQACGATCAPAVQELEVQNVWTAKTPLGDYDLAVQLYNPNTQYGVSEGIYNLDTGQAASQALSDQRFYMLPGQTKYLVLTSLPEEVQSVSIQRVDWERVNVEPDVMLTLVREAFTPAPTTVYEAVVRNDSDFDLDSVDVGVAVFDSAGNLLATNISNFQTFRSGTERSVRMTWPFPLSADARIQLEVGTNLFDNDNFIKRNGTQERFQQYF